MSMEWVNIKDKLPKLIKYKDGSVNGVFVRYKNKPVCSFREQVSNVEFVLKHLELFTHWCEFPKLKRENK
jgi:hypothetical protein